MAGSPFVHTLRVRYGECDPQGIVFNSHYLAYFDIALTEIWRAALPGGYRQMQAANVDMVVAEATCRYRAPARFDDELAVAVAIAHLGTTSMTTRMEIDRVAAAGGDGGWEEDLPGGGDGGPEGHPPGGEDRRREGHPPGGGDESRQWTSPVDAPRPERVAEGEMRHVFVALPGHVKTPIPAWIRSALEPWTTAPVAA